MKLTSAPEYFDPIRMLSEGTEYSGILSLDKLPNFADLIHSSVSGLSCQYSIKAETGQHSLLCLTGAILADIPLICQRCLNPMTESVNTKFVLYPVKESAIATLPKELDPILLDERRSTVSLSELLEQELTLAIPMTPKHKETECNTALGE